MISTTPKRLAALTRILDEPTTVRTVESTYANRLHLAKEFVDQIVSLYEGTRIGRQEIYAEFLDTSDGAWFARFDPSKHVSLSAEHHPAYETFLAIDCGISQHVGAVFFQVEQLDQYRHRVTVFGEYLCKGRYSAENAAAIKQVAMELPCRGRLSRIRLDPASVAHSGIGPAAYGEFEKVFGSRIIGRTPRHGVADALDFMEMLLDRGLLVLHPRCKNLISAFQNYSRAQRGGEFLDTPADSQSPAEDMVDALRYGIRDKFPEGQSQQPNLKNVHFCTILN